LSAVLHTLNAAPGEPAFADCLRVLRAADSLLLLGDGVSALLPGEAAVALEQTGAQLFILREDALAAGLNLHDLCAVVVDMCGFVELSERHARQLAWF